VVCDDVMQLVGKSALVLTIKTEASKYSKERGLDYEIVVRGDFD